jgi:hypothetical protein
MSSPSLPVEEIETVEEEFVHPFIETVRTHDGTFYFRPVAIHRDAVEDYIMERTPCILLRNGTPLKLARQEAYMKHLEETVEQNQRASIKAEAIQKIEKKKSRKVKK